MTLEQIQKLTDDELRVRVAELAGYKNIRRSSNGQPYAQGSMECSTTGIPNYPADLNACARFEATLAEWDESAMRSPYREYLWALQKIMPCLSRVPCAPARQRCEAFLSVMGKDTP